MEQLIKRKSVSNHGSAIQVVNDKKETDKNMEVVDQNIYWMQNGQHNLITMITGGTVSSEKYNDSPVIEVEQGALRSNEFNLNDIFLHLKSSHG